MGNNGSLERRELYKTDHILIEHYPSVDAIFYCLTGYIEEKEAHEFFEKVLHFIKETQCHHLIADISEFRGGNLSLAKYVNQIWTQKLSANGVRRIAMNTPKSKFGEFSNRIAAGQNAHEFIQFKEFNSFNEAVNWLADESS